MMCILLLFFFQLLPSARVSTLSQLTSWAWTCSFRTHCPPSYRMQILFYSNVVFKSTTLQFSTLVRAATHILMICRLEHTLRSTCNTFDFLFSFSQTWIHWNLTQTWFFSILIILETWRQTVSTRASFFFFFLWAKFSNYTVAWLNNHCRLCDFQCKQTALWLDTHSSAWHAWTLFKPESEHALSHEG